MFALIHTRVSGEDLFLARLRGTANLVGSGGADDVYVAPALKPGVWHEIRLETRLSWGRDGYSRLFINGRKVYDVKRTTAFNDEKEPFFQYGLYRPNLKRGPGRVDRQSIDLRPVRFEKR